MIGVDRDADGDVDVERDRLDLHRLLQRGPQLGGQADRVVGVGQPQRHHELVAAAPADQRRRRGERPQPGGHLDDHAVAGVVADRVVDVAQAVDVEDQHRDDLARRLDLDRLLEQRQHPAPVRQPGQRVVVGVEAQPVDQARVLHRDRGVRGQRLQQPHVGLPELGQVAEPAGDLERADHRRAGPQRHHDRVLDAAVADQRAQSGSPTLAPDHHRRRRRPTARSRRHRGVLLSSSRPGASTRALSSSSG